MRKTAKKAARGVPFAKGRDPRRGVGQPGRSGRKPLAFLAECELLADNTVLPKVDAYLRAADPSDPAWRWCAQYVTEYSKQRPPAKVEVATPPPPPKLYLPNNGRGPRQAADSPPITPPRSLRMPTRPSAAPPNGDGPPGYLWSDGTRRSLPEDGG